MLVLTVVLEQHGDIENDGKLLECDTEQDGEVQDNKEEKTCFSMLKDTEANDVDIFEQLPNFIEDDSNIETEHGQEQIKDLFFIIQQRYQLLGGEDFSIEHV